MFHPDAYPELIYADAADRVKSLQRRQAELVTRQVRSQQRRQQVLTLLRIKRMTTKPRSVDEQPSVGALMT